MIKIIVNMRTLELFSTVNEINVIKINTIKDPTADSIVLQQN